MENLQQQMITAFCCGKDKNHHRCHVMLVFLLLANSVLSVREQEGRKMKYTHTQAHTHMKCQKYSKVYSV